MALLPPFAYTLTQGFGPSALSIEPAGYGSPDKQQGSFAAIAGWTRYSHFHPALDLAAPKGTPILASEDGVVTQAGLDAGLSLRVQIRPGVTYSHSHCNSLLVKVGDSVKRGQQIATVGMTGLATGPHSHFWVGFGAGSGMLYQNPLRFLPGGDLVNDPRITSEDTVLIPPASYTKIGNKRTSVIASPSANFREDRFTVSAVIKPFPTGTVFFPVASASDGTNAGGATPTTWYGGLLYSDHPPTGVRFGWFHSSVVGPLMDVVVPIDSAAAVARAVAPLNTRITNAKAALG